MFLRLWEFQLRVPQPLEPAGQPWVHQGTQIHKRPTSLWQLRGAGDPRAPWSRRWGWLPAGGGWTWMFLTSDCKIITCHCYSHWSEAANPKPVFSESWVMYLPTNFPRGKMENQKAAFIRAPLICLRCYSETCVWDPVHKNKLFPLSCCFVTKARFKNSHYF